METLSERSSAGLKRHPLVANVRLKLLNRPAKRLNYSGILPLLLLLLPAVIGHKASPLCSGVVLRTSQHPQAMIGHKASALCFGVVLHESQHRQARARGGHRPLRLQRPSVAGCAGPFCQPQGFGSGPENIMQAHEACI